MPNVMIALLTIFALSACGPTGNSKKNGDPNKGDDPKSEKAIYEGFYDVKEIGCNGNFQPSQKGDRIFLHSNRAIIGFGHTAADGCRVVDFQDFVITATDESSFNLTPRSKVGRRSSCSDEITNYEGIEFKEAIVFNDGLIVLTGMPNCELYAIKLKK